MEIYKTKVAEFNGEDVIEYKLDNGCGLVVSILNLGLTITEIKTRDKYGEEANIVLAYEDKEDYIKNPSYYGATIGRTSGRIYKGEVEIDGNKYFLNKNYGENQGHGGDSGFSNRIWTIKEIINKDYVGIEGIYESKDGEEGYPGNVQVRVEYIIRNDNRLIFKTNGVSDKKTLLNLTNHSYFNLSGDYKEDILGHTLQMNCDKFLEIDEKSVVTGKAIDCNTGDFSFIEGKEIGKDINNENIQLKYGNGYDHPFLFKDRTGVITLSHKTSGRFMRVRTNHEAVVVYSQNYCDNKKLVKGKDVKERMGICLEVQSPPIGYNEVFKENSILEANRLYNKGTEYQFGVL